MRRLVGLAVLLSVTACKQATPSAMPTTPPETSMVEPTLTPGLETLQAEAIGTLYAVGSATANAPTHTVTPSLTPPIPMTDTPIPVLAQSGRMTEPEVDFA